MKVADDKPPDYDKTAPADEPWIPKRNGGRKRAYHRPEDNIDMQIGIYLGAEWSIVEIAQHIGLTPAAVQARRSRNKVRVEAASSWTRIAISKYVEDRVKAAEDEIRDRKKRVLGKGYKLVEKVIDEGLKDDTIADKTHLQAAEIGIERTEGKAIDRKAILEQHNYTIEVEGGDLDLVLRELSQLNAIRRAALPPASLDQNGLPILEGELVSK